MQHLHLKQAELGNLIWLRVLIQSMDSEQLIHLHLTLEDNLTDIVGARIICSFESDVYDVVDIIKKSMPYKEREKAHPARRTFQAIRIEVNHELSILRQSHSY